MTPMAQPNVRPLIALLLPPWRFGSNIRSANDPAVDGLSDEAVVAEWCFAALVIIGVAGEFIIAARHPPYDSCLGQWGPAFGDLLVAIGVAGEVVASVISHLCQAELTRRAKKELSDATDRLAQVEFEAGFTEEKLERAVNELAQAQRELAETTKRAARVEWRAAHLDAEAQKMRLRASTAEQELQRLSGPRMPDKRVFLEELADQPMPSKIDVVYSMDGPDCFSLAGWIAAFLKDAGWPIDPAHATPLPRSEVLNLSAAMAAGGQPWGITVLDPDLKAGKGTPAHALLNALLKSTGDRQIAGVRTEKVVSGCLRVIVAPRT